MNLSSIKSSAQGYLTEHATGILTYSGALGTVATAVLTARASFKAAQVIQEQIADNIVAKEPDPDLTKGDKVKLVWPHFVPPVACGAATVTAIVMANHLNAKRVAALATLYSLSENRLKEYQEKVASRLTGPKNQAVKDEIAQDRVNRTPNREIVILDGKTVLCFDEFSGRYFNSTMDNIRRAELSTNGELYNHGYASLSYFYDELEVAPTGYSDMVGWNSATTGPLELKFSTVMSPDSKPCLAVDFVTAPTVNYATLY